MNAVFDLEVNSFRKPVKDFGCLTSVGKLFHRTASLYSRSYFYSNWFVAREQQACFQNLIRIK